MRNFWDLIASLDCLNGLLRTIFKVIMSFPSRSFSQHTNAVYSLLSVLISIHLRRHFHVHWIVRFSYLTRFFLLGDFVLKTAFWIVLLKNLFLRHKRFSWSFTWTDFVVINIAYLLRTKALFFLRTNLGTNMSDIYLLVELRVRYDLNVV